MTCSYCDPHEPMGVSNTRCEQCGCCNHEWREDCTCDKRECGCWMNRTTEGEEP